jgi:hypothetical protein
MWIVTLLETNAPFGFQETPMAKKTSMILSLFATGLLCGSAIADDRSTGRSQNKTLPQPRAVENQSEWKPSVGLLMGYSALNGGEFSNNAAALVEAAFQPVIPFGLGAQFQYSPGDVQSSGPNPDWNTTNLLLKGTYNFGGNVVVLRNSYVGAKTGLTLYSGDVPTETHFSLGPVVGFDIPVDVEKHFTLGAEGTYLGVLGDASPDQVSLLGAAKYWF